MARVLEILGPVFYVVFNALIIGALVVGSKARDGAFLQLVGLGENRNYPNAILIALGFVIFVFACGTVWNDHRDLAREEVDVEWVSLRPDAAGLLFAAPSEREGLYRRDKRQASAGPGARVETLMNDRVRRVLERQRDRAVRVSPDELRVIAETRTSRYGSIARFASSLLLLLTVLGTFAGVKTALPGLIDAVSSTGASGRGGAGITAPLQAVADAFGGNALALVGAISLGLMAQGLSMGRRNLLERLELASEPLYGGLQHTDTADPLTGAIHALRDTAADVAEAGQAISGVEVGINSLGATVREAFDGMKASLVELTEQQHRMLQERTSKELRELQRRVVEMAAVVEQNTRAYQGIVDTVGERARESHEAIALVRDSAVALQSALHSVASFQGAAERSARGVQDSLVALQSGSTLVVERMESVADSVERAKPAIGEIERLLQSVGERVAAADERSAGAWSHASREVNDRLGELIRELRPTPQPDPARERLPAVAADPEVAGLLRRVLSAVEGDRGPSPRSIALAQGAGTLAALAVAYAGYVGLRALFALAGG